MAMVTKADFIGDDGLMHCGICGEPKEMRAAQVVINGSRTAPKTFPVQCACERAESDRAIREHEERERRARIERNRVKCFPHLSMHDMDFAHDDSPEDKVSQMCRRYAGSFARFRDAGAGLIFHGPVGTGKTFYAAAIANQLVTDGYKVLFTSLSTLGGRMQADYGRDKLDILRDICKMDCVVLDDLGIERTTPTMSENVYQVINALYQSGTVMIFTTNADFKAMAQDREPDKLRIYSRIFECCKAVEVKGTDRRKAKAKEKAALFKDVLG